MNAEWGLLSLTLIIIYGVWSVLRSMSRIEQQIKDFRDQIAKTFTPGEIMLERGYAGYLKWSDQRLAHIVRLLEHIANSQGVSPERIKEIHDEIIEPED